MEWYWFRPVSNRHSPSISIISFFSVKLFLVLYGIERKRRYHDRGYEKSRLSQLRFLSSNITLFWFLTSSCTKQCIKSCCAGPCNPGRHCVLGRVPTWASERLRTVRHNMSRMQNLVHTQVKDAETSTLDRSCSYVTCSLKATSFVGGMSSRRAPLSSAVTSSFEICQTHEDTS
jgi:hypothetical protein